MVGKSVETALHQMENRFEGVLEQKEIAMGVFMDIERAYDNTSIESMTRALVARGVSNPIV